jgi:hypothetical protein
VTAADVSAAIGRFPRNLSWRDYQQVTASRAPPQDAWTVVEGNAISWGSPQVQNGQYRPVGVRLEIRLVSSDTWVVQGKQSPLLLKHEQGHYDICGLLHRDLVRKILNLAIDVSVAQRQGRLAGGPTRWVTKQFSDQVAAGTRELERLIGSLQTVAGSNRDGEYDRQTNHGKKIREQVLWDIRFMNLIYAQRDASFREALKHAGVIH